MDAQDRRPIDLGSMRSPPVRLPAFTSSTPRFGLFLFGPESDVRVWAVLDQSQADADDYDVLYLDLDSDGDLTEPRERFLGTRVEQKEQMSRRFVIGEFWPRGSKAPHQEFTITWWAPGHVTFRMRWYGRERTVGGFGRLADEKLRFGDSVANAPVLVPGCDQPLQFQRRGDEPLQRKHVEELTVLAGNPGSGTASFSFIDARSFEEEDTLVATLVYHDSRGRSRSKRFEWRDSC